MQESQNVRLEGDLKDYLIQLSWQKHGLVKITSTLSGWILNEPNIGKSTTFQGWLFQRLIFLIMKNVPLLSNWIYKLIYTHYPLSFPVAASDKISHKHSSLKAERAWSLFASPGPCGCFPGLFQSPADASAFPLAPCLPHPAGWALCQVFWGFPFVSCSSKGQSLKKHLLLFLCGMSVCGLSVCIKLLLLNK